MLSSRDGKNIVQRAKKIQYSSQQEGPTVVSILDFDI